MESLRMAKRIRLAGLLVGGGLFVQAASLTVLQPWAFLAFLVIGCPLAIAGIVIYLLSLLQE